MTILHQRLRPFGRGLTLPVALGLVALMVTGCADDPYADSVALTPQEQQEEMAHPPAGAAAALLRVAKATLAAGDYTSSINVLKRAHTIAPDDAAVSIALGETLAAVGAYNEARDVLVKTIASRPHDTRAIRDLANVLVALSQPEIAITRYRQALAIKPEAATYNGLGVALDVTGDAKAAQDAYRKGLALAPADASLIGNLGLSLALSGKTKAAIDLLARELREGRTTPRLRQNLALIYGLAGRNRDARAILRIDLDEASVRNNIAYYEMLRGLSSENRRETVLGVRRVVPGRETAAAMVKPADPPKPATPSQDDPAKAPEPAATAKAGP